MSEIERLLDELRKRLPAIGAEIDEPERSRGSSFLDLEYAGRKAVVEWRPGRGFGVLAREEVLFGEGPDEIYPDLESAVDRVEQLLRLGVRTRPPEGAVLRKLRESRRLSQEELAGKLHVTQAAVSKMERRSDMYLSTLRNAVSAMGGELELRARFPEGSYEIVQFRELQGRSVTPSGRKGSGRRTEDS
jgi:DNA-binding XRE family transcriptional regulator